MSVLVDRLRDGSVSVTAALNALAVDTGGSRGSEAAFTRSLFALVVDVLEVEGVDVARDVTARG